MITIQCLKCNFNVTIEGKDPIKTMNYLIKTKYCLKCKSKLIISKDFIGGKSC